MKSLMKLIWLKTFNQFVELIWFHLSFIPALISDFSNYYNIPEWLLGLFSWIQFSWLPINQLNFIRESKTNQQQPIRKSLAGSKLLNLNNFRAWFHFRLYWIELELKTFNSFHSIKDKPEKKPGNPARN